MKASAFVFLTGLFCCSSVGQAAVEIHLRDTAEVSESRIQLSDVADIRADSDATAQKLSELDVAVLDEDSESLLLTARRISIRLRLAGFTPDAFVLTGSPDVLVQRLARRPITDSRIEQAAIPTMVSALGVDADHLSVQLSTPLVATLPRVLRSDPDIRVEVLPPLTPRIGTVSLTVRLWRGSQLVHTRSGRFEVLQKQHVAIARTSLPRGHVIQPGDVRFLERFLAAPADQLDESQVIGRQTRSMIPAGSMISQRDLQQPTPARAQAVIKARDNVRVTAVSGRLQVRLTSAQALESGRIGDIIRVRNLRSKNIVTGRVVGPGEVEIRL